MITLKHTISIIALHCKKKLSVLLRVFTSQNPESKTYPSRFHKLQSCSKALGDLIFSGFRGFMSRSYMLQDAEVKFYPGLYVHPERLWDDMICLRRGFNVFASARTNKSPPPSISHLFSRAEIFGILGKLHLAC